MKNLTVTLLDIMMSLLLMRHYPYVSKKLVLKYITTAYLSFRSGKFINNDAADLISTQEKVY
jgi:hypothetical protein